MLDLILWRAKKSGDQPALFFNGRWYSYAELNLLANRLANRLLDLGVQQGDRVGIISYNHVAHFHLIFAAAKIGIIYTPFNYRLTAAELGALSRQVRPTLMFVDTRHQSIGESLGVPWTRLSDYKEWLAAGSSAPPPAPTRPLTEDDTHMILFTGGTTGLPKAAMLPYRQTILNARVTAEAWDIRASDCAIQCTPCFHSAVNALSLPLFYKGGRVVLTAYYDPDEYLGCVSTHRVTILFMVPTMYQMLANYPDFPVADLSSVRWAVFGGENCPPSVWQAFASRNIRLRQGFGMTEAGVNCFNISLEQAELTPDSVGYPMPQMEAVLRNADGSAVVQGQVGELTLRGPMVFKGYHERSHETHDTLRDGWVWTGDLMRQDEQGRYYMLGRRKDMYISGGENVFPAEVEDALCQCDGVREATVIGVPDPHWGEHGFAVVVMRQDFASDPEGLRAQLRTMIAGYKIPKTFQFMHALPKNGAGKVVKEEIRRLHLTGYFDQALQRQTSYS